MAQSLQRGRNNAIKYNYCKIVYICWRKNFAFSCKKKLFQFKSTSIKKQHEQYTFAQRYIFAGIYFHICLSMKSEKFRAQQILMDSQHTRLECNSFRLPGWTNSRRQKHMQVHCKAPREVIYTRQSTWGMQAHITLETLNWIFFVQMGNGGNVNKLWKTRWLYCTNDSFRQRPLLSVNLQAMYKYVCTITLDPCRGL